MVKRPFKKVRWITSRDAGGVTRYYPYHVQDCRAELLVFTGQWDAAERLMLDTLGWTGGQAGRRLCSGACWSWTACEARWGSTHIAVDNSMPVW